MLRRVPRAHTVKHFRIQTVLRNKKDGAAMGTDDVERVPRNRKDRNVLRLGTGKRFHLKH